MKIEIVLNKIDRKIKLDNDFINRLDSNPMGFPLNDIRNLKIFKQNNYETTHYNYLNLFVTIKFLWSK